jgi:GR25 family glycosyltransferase involved in LPS biosynthesis
MKIFVINLKKDKEKLNSILAQFKKYNITDFEIVEAVNGSELSNEELLEKYDEKRTKRVFRELSLPEIGCTLSHLAVYKKIIKENKRCLIIEDDVILKDDIEKFNSYEIKSDVDIMFFGLFTSNLELNKNQKKKFKFEKLKLSYNDKKIVSRCYLKDEKENHNGIDFYRIDQQSYLIDFIQGTHAYAPSPSCCKKLISINTPIIFIADNIWNYTKFSLYTPINNLIELNYNYISDLEKERKLLTKTKNFSNVFLKRITNIKFGT